VAIEHQVNFRACHSFLSLPICGVWVRLLNPFLPQ